MTGCYLKHKIGINLILADYTHFQKSGSTTLLVMTKWLDPDSIMFFKL